MDPRRKASKSNLYPESQKKYLKKFLKKIPEAIPGRIPEVTLVEKPDRTP